MNKAKDKPMIFAYGFDAAGFTIPSDPLETAKCVIRFIGYSAEQSLEEADGIITPSGIFEDFKSSNNYYGGGHIIHGSSAIKTIWRSASRRYFRITSAMVGLRFC